MKNFAPILMMLSALGLFFVNRDNVNPEPVNPTKPDILDVIYENDRAAIVSVLTELQTKDFDTDQELFEWYRDETDKKKQEVWKPFAEALAAIVVENPNAEYKSMAELVEAIK